MVRIKHAQNTLQPVDYTQYLRWILEEVQRVAPFRFRNGRLSLEADSLADKIATRRAEKLSNPIIGNSSLMRTSTVYFNDQTGTSFETLTAQIYRALHTQLEATLVQHQLTPASCLASIQTSLSSLKEKGQRGVPGFAYPFESTPPLQRKRLRIVPETASTSPPALLRLSRAKLRISGLDTFFGQVEQALTELCSLERCIKACGGDHDAGEEMHEELQELLGALVKNPQSELTTLQDILANETVGQMKKVSLLQYLEFLELQLARRHVTLGKEHQLGRQYLQNLIERLHMLDTFIWNRASDDGFYDISFGRFQANLRDLYARSDALGKLPIIPLVEGSLGETTSKDLGTNEFRFGLKLKMDGRVSGHLQIPTGQETERVHDAFHFYLNQLDPLNRAYQDGMAGENPQAFVDKIMLVLLTYYFVFTDIGNQQYNPTQDFETTVLDRLKRGTAEQKVDLLREFVTSLRTAPAVADAIIRLPIFFRALLRKRERPFLPQSAAYHLRVRRGLLEPKLSTVLQERSFFRRGILSGTYKQALKYIRLEDATFSADALCKLDADIHLDDVLFYPSTDPAESFSLAYEIGDTPALPVLLVPIDDQVVPVYERYFRDEHPIVIPYRLRKGKTRDEQRQFDADWIGNYGFLYRFVFSLLTFLSLQLLLALRPSLRSVNERVFLPIFRLHANPKQQPSREETFIRDFSIVCAHLLSERHLANHQGFYSTDLTALLARMPTQPPKGHPRCRCPHPSRVAFAMP